MEFEQITTELADHVFTITLNRPERLNAFTTTMGDELRAAFDDADADDEVRAVIVTGAGRGFCAGADLGRGSETFTKREHEDPDSIPRDGGGRLTLRIFECTKPVIAAINGPAVGIGATMTLPMDVRLASESARDRVRVLPPRDRAGGVLELVPAAGRRHQPGDGMGRQRPGVRRTGRRSRAAWSAASIRPASSSRPRARSRVRSPTTPRRCRWRWHG